MATRSLMAMIVTSWLAVLLLAFGAVASEDQAAVRRNSGEFLSTTGSEASSRADAWCPAVCPACPGAPRCPSAPPCPRQIPPGYKSYEPLGYYKMHYEEKNWSQAKGACEREGGYLAVINSQEEADLTSQLMNKYDIVFMHIGFFDIAKNGTYVTVLDEPLSSLEYQGWGPGEPNHVGEENCGSFLPNKGINDGTCEFPSPFLCELLP